MMIDGKKIAAEIIGALQKKRRPAKHLAVILVGNNASSLSFVRQKEKTAKKLDINFDVYRYPMDISGEKLREEILKIAGDNPAAAGYGGIILQLPLPKHLNREEIIKIIPPGKDVDNLTGKATVLAPAVSVVETIIENCKLKIENLKVAVIGRGLLVGKPIALWLKNKTAEVSVYGNDAIDLKRKLKEVDVVISGVGKAGLFGPEDLKNGALVIDFGYDLKGGKIFGDFDVSQSSNVSGQLSYTPTPGGTGPILVAKLFENFYKLASG